MGVVCCQLDEMLKAKDTGIDKVVNLEIPDDLLLKRITGRQAGGAHTRAAVTSPWAGLLTRLCP